MSSHRSPSEVRANLKHPIIDGDGHWVEYNPVFAERMRRLAGTEAADGFIASQRRIPDALKLSIAERKQRGVAMEGYWTRQSTNTLDRATAMMPRLMYERLADLGIDFAVVYPTAGLGYHRMQDTRMRRAICRAYNVFAADQFGGLEDRVIPAAIIPMYTPEEAIEEIEFAATQLGYKVIMVGGDAAAGAGAPRSGPTRRASSSGTTGRPRQPPRLRPGVAQVPRAQLAPTFHNGARGFCCATRRRTSATTTSATSPPRATRWPRRSSSAASPGASRTSTSPSSRAAWAGPACSTRT